MVVDGTDWQYLDASILMKQNGFFRSPEYRKSDFLFRADRYLEHRRLRVEFRQDPIRHRYKCEEKYAGNDALFVVHFPNVPREHGNPEL